MEEYYNVLNVLKNSKKYWDKPPLDYGPDNPEDSDYNRNGLKDVGDLSKVDFSQQYSFVSETEIIEECQPSGSKDTESTDFLQQSFYNVEATSEQGHLYSDRPSALEIARKAHEQFKLHHLLKRLSLEKEYKQEVQRKTLEKQETYLQHLNKIHIQHEEEAVKYYQIQKEKLKDEENLLRQQQEEALRAIQHCKKEYTIQVSKHSSQLLEAVESAKRQEAEQANLVQSLLAQLQTVNADFVNKMDIMYQIINELEGSETINKNMEAHLHQTKSQVEGILNISHQRPPTRIQIDEVQKVLQQGLTIVESIIQKLEAKKMEKANQEAKRIQENEDKAKAAALEVERQEALRRQRSLENQQESEEKKDIVPEANNEDRLLDLKQRVKHYLEANENLSKDKLWEVRRKASLANQLNKDNHSINRDKLQKLLNEMRERKAEAEVLASYKNSVTSNIVKQVAIQDSLGASAYSWLLVELVTFHPDLWDLFLYYLFKACPMLMPGSQINEEILGNIEKPEVYYSQVGKYSTMYGFVLTRLNKKQGSPIKAAAIGWEVLANIVSQPPLSGITGELLLKILQSCGYTLQQTYMKQFAKVMEFISKCYLPKVREATEGGGQNCLTLLENFMTEYRPNKLTQNHMILKYM